MSSTQLLPELKTQVWQILTTPPLSGEENMAYDLRTLQAVQSESIPPTLRFFRWSEPTVSYGKHQSIEQLHSRIPADWPAVQRPTGGGVVFHGEDLCLSLCWRVGQPPLPARLKDHYAWIHNIILETLHTLPEARLATCHDCPATPTPFAIRDCFTRPVGYDVLSGDRKIVGGALCRKLDTFLYQGSIQGLPTQDLEEHIQNAFGRALRLR